MRLNAKTVHDRFPMTHTHELTSTLKCITDLSTADLAKAYNRNLNVAEIIPKTAITTPYWLYSFRFNKWCTTFRGIHRFQSFMKKALSNPDNLWPFQTPYHLLLVSTFSLFYFCAYVIRHCCLLLSTLIIVGGILCACRFLDSSFPCSFF